jgi:hypothetical protein
LLPTAILMYASSKRFQLVQLQQGFGIILSIQARDVYTPWETLQICVMEMEGPCYIWWSGVGGPLVLDATNQIEPRGKKPLSRATASAFTSPTGFIDCVKSY